MNDDERQAIKKLTERLKKAHVEIFVAYRYLNSEDNLEPKLDNLRGSLLSVIRSLEVRIANDVFAQD